MAGGQRTLLDLVRPLAPLADVCVAVGTCAAYGGIPASDPDPTDACGLQYDGAESGGALGRDYRSRKNLPVINVAGCAPHPGWIMETLQALASSDLAASDLDALGRPKFFAGHLAHHGCARNEFYEFKASAKVLSKRGCMMEHLGQGDAGDRRFATSAPGMAAAPAPTAASPAFPARRRVSRRRATFTSRQKSPAFP